MIKPAVSIILPTYKNPPWLERSIESVIRQGFSDWELIIVDDGLDLNAKSIIARFSANDPRIKCLVNERNLGIQKSLNRALDVAQGEFVARIDDDDEWIDPRKLGEQIGFLNTHREYVLVGTNAIICDSRGNDLGMYSVPETDNAIRKRILFKNCFLHPTIMARRNSIIQVGGYDENENTRHIEDYALWLALGRIGKLANLPLRAARLTVHEESMTAQNRVIQAKRMQNIIREYRDFYPHYLFGYLLLTLRWLGFTTISTIPIPKRILYIIQRLYKNT